MIPATHASPLGCPSLENDRCVGLAFANYGLLREVVMTGENATLAVVLGGPHQNERPLDHNGEHKDVVDDSGKIIYYNTSGPDFRNSPAATLVLTALTIRTLAGDECRLDGIQIPAWPETAREAWRDHKDNDGDRDAPVAQSLPADLNTLLSAQHPGSDLADPTQYELQRWYRPTPTCRCYP